MGLGKSFPENDGRASTPQPSLWQIFIAQGPGICSKASSPILFIIFSAKRSNRKLALWPQRQQFLVFTLVPCTSAPHCPQKSSPSGDKQKHLVYTDLFALEVPLPLGPPSSNPSRNLGFGVGWGKVKSEESFNSPREQKQDDYPGCLEEWVKDQEKEIPPPLHLFSPLLQETTNYSQWIKLLHYY